MILAKRSRAAIGVHLHPFAVTKIEITLTFTKMFKLTNFPSERFVILKFRFLIWPVSVFVSVHINYIKHTSI